MTLLLLSGTGEGQRIAQDLAARGVKTILSLSGEARIVDSSGLPRRIGGFGGDEGFRRFVVENGIRAVLDATHPFACRITARTAHICAEFSLPYCLVLRPNWRPEAGDRWVFLDREEDAAAHVPEGATVFLTTGRQTLERFANLSGRWLFCRRIGAENGVFPLPNGDFLKGEPPFSVADERATFERLGVDWLIVKNAGGEVPRTKLIAARQLGLPVALINRPSPPKGIRLVETVAEALEWVAAL